MSGRTALRWSGYIAFAVVFAIACAFLSNWQFARNDDRSEQLALVEANYDAPPSPLNELIPVGSTLDPADEWHPALLRGRYLADQQVLVRNRPHGGTSAFEVLVPFLTADGRTFVVDRGWVAPAASGPHPEDVPAPPTGTVEVVVRLKAGEAAPTSGRSAPEGQVPTINLELIADEAGLDASLVDSAYGLMVSEAPAVAAPAPIAPPSEDPGPHLSYAIQWILFAIMGFVFIWYMIRTERRHRQDEEQDAAAEAAASSGTALPGATPARQAADPPTPAPAAPVVPESLRRRAPARQDRDMQDEDAILDSRHR